MTLTFSMTELDEICEYALSYDINMINDTNGIINLFSIMPHRENELNNEGIHLYLDVKAWEKPVDGEEFFDLHRLNRKVINNPHEKNSSRELDTSGLASVRDFNDLIFAQMKSQP